MNYFLDVVKNHYADFDGRARRSEYWYFTLFNVLGAIAILLVTMALGAISDILGMVGTLAYLAYALGLLIPGIAVAVRRLHDTGKSGWWMLIAFIPLAGIVLLVFMCMDSDPGVNAFGPNPKEAAAYNDVADHLVE